MTTSASNEENESSYDADGFRAFMEAMGVKTVKRMGSARDLASVSRLLCICAFFVFLRSELVGGRWVANANEWD